MAASLLDQLNARTAKPEVAEAVCEEPNDPWGRGEAWCTDAVPVDRELDDEDDETEQALASATSSQPAEASGKPRRVCYEHGPYEGRCPTCATKLQPTETETGQAGKCEHQWEAHFSAQMCKLCGRCRSQAAAIAEWEQRLAGNRGKSEPQEEPRPSGEQPFWDSPLPWSIVDEEDFATLVRVVDANGENVARCASDDDARFIVSRCNAPEPAATVSQELLERVDSNLRALLQVLEYDGARTRGEGSVLVGEALPEYQERTEPAATVARSEVEAKELVK